MEEVINIQDLQGLPHVLVVDDDDRIRDLVVRYLNSNGFLALEAADADAAQALMEVFTFDIAVLDVMMPGRSGVDLTRDVRASGHMPVLLLTAMGETEDRVAGLSAGADDYLVKPFDPRELVLRIQAILRRSRSAPTVADDMRIGRWVFEAACNELVCGTERVRLTDVEANLLKALAGRAGEVFSREDLAGLCGAEAGERTIDVQVTRLRRKLEEDGKAPRYLQTVRGKGYMLRVE